MFLCAADGSSKIPMESERSRTELWSAMMQVLKATYGKEPEGQVRKMERTIDEFDSVDQRIAAIEKRMDELLETDGPDSKKLKKLKDDLGVAHKERRELFNAIDQATAEYKIKKVAEAKGANAASSPKGS